MDTLDKFRRIRKDFYNDDRINYDSVSYFTAIEKDLKLANFINDFIENYDDMGGRDDLIPLNKAIRTVLKYYKSRRNYDI